MTHGPAWMSSPGLPASHSDGPLLWLGTPLLWAGLGALRVTEQLMMRRACGCGLARDDYGGYLSYDTQLARARQCLAHLYSRNASRGGDGVLRLRPPALDIGALTSRTRWA